MNRAWKAARTRGEIDMSLLDFAVQRSEYIQSERVACVAGGGCLRVNYSVEMVLIQCARHRHLIAHRLRLPAEQ